MSRSSVAVEGPFLSGRNTLAGATLSAATAVNATVALALGRFWELFGSVRNIFDERYSDPVSSGHRQDSIAQNGRTARIGIRWRLGPKPLPGPGYD